jgi:putative phosphoribosyl transferase
VTPTFNLGHLPLANPVEDPLRQAKLRNQLCIQIFGAAARYRAESQLLLAGGTDLPNDEHVQGGPQPPRHLESDGNSTARKRQYDGVYESSPLADSLGQHPAGLAPVGEWGRVASEGIHTPSVAEARLARKSHAAGIGRDVSHSDNPEHVGHLPKCRLALVPERGHAHDAGMRTMRNVSETASAGVVIPAGVPLQADLAVPPNARGVVAFAHGSGSGRFSPRNRRVAERLRDHGHATLLLDLLTPDEERIDQRTRELRFDIGLLAERLVAAVDWLHGDGRTRELGIGLYGASTGAAAALVAAARRPALVRAVVSRGGRPDLATAALAHVTAPTLLIVGGHDLDVLGLNREAASQMSVAATIEVIPAAGHLFEEPGALERVAELAAEWFDRNLGAAPTGTQRRGLSAN